MNSRYHLIAIGGGTGGLVTAAGAAGLGVHAALIEKHKMGGDCLNTGCVPSKAIIRAAKLVYDARTAERFGLEARHFDIDFNRVMASVREVQAKIEYADSVERFEDLGVAVYKGHYRFISPYEISDGQKTLAAKRFVIATGAAPFVPPIAGLNECGYLTSDNVWELDALPKRLVVLGGGPIGSELSQVFARLGSEVTQVQMAPRLLTREDEDVSAVIRKRFEAEGIEVLTGWKAEMIEPVDGAYRLKLTHPEAGERWLTFDKILLAVGRAPNVDQLNLEAAGVRYSSRGVELDSYLRTSQKHIYACGDVAGSYQFTHTADYQARLILRNALFPGKSRINYRVVPWCTFTDPEVARVGMNEQEAQQLNVSYDVYRYDLNELDRALCDREGEGFIKVLTRKGKDQILGATLVGSHTGDCLHEIVLAMQNKIGLKKIAGMIHVYPTLAEMTKRIADSYQRTRLSPGKRRALLWYFSWRFGCNK